MAVRISEKQFRLLSPAETPATKPARARHFRLKPPPKPKLRENDVESVIVDFLRRHGWRVDRQHVGKARFPNGTWFNLHPTGSADWFAHRPRMSPSCLYAEVKAPGREADPDQISYLEAARREGYLAGCFDSFESFLFFYGTHFPEEIQS